MINNSVNIFLRKLTTYPWRYIKCVWSMILIKYGYKYDKSRIPKDTLYCYDYLDDGEYRICPYREPLNWGRNGCRYLGVISDCPVFDDACKICGENYPDYSEQLKTLKDGKK